MAFQEDDEVAHLFLLLLHEQQLITPLVRLREKVQPGRRESLDTFVDHYPTGLPGSQGRIGLSVTNAADEHTEDPTPRVMEGATYGGLETLSLVIEPT